MESFAQTGGGQDELFNDYEESMETRAQDDLFGDDFEPAAEEVEVEVPITSQPEQTFSRGLEPSRGRGRGGRGRGDYGHTNDRQHAPQAQQQTPSLPSAPAAASVRTVTAARPVGLLDSKHAPAPTTDSTEGKSATPTNEDSAANTPAAPRITKPASVRGDRTATGGTARVKLTEEELAARMESVKLKNASLEAAHARAQADADSFAEREDEAAKKRQIERRDRQQMMGEREKNRQRKLKAQEGREWDSEKRQEDFTIDNRRGYGRGAHGGVSGTRLGGQTSRTVDDVQSDGREYLYREDRGRGGGRGNRGGGAARGGRGEPEQGFSHKVPARDDFPVLAPKATEKPSESKDEGVAKVAPVLTFPKSLKDKTNHETNGAAVKPSETKQSWADMVEDSKT